MSHPIASQLGETKQALSLAHLDRVLVASFCHVALRGRRDLKGRPVRVAHLGRLLAGEQVEVVRAVSVLLVVHVHHANLVPGPGGAFQGLRHDDVVVAFVVGAALLAVGAESGHPLAAFVL